MNPIHSFYPYFPKIHFNIILPSTPRSSQWPLSFRLTCIIYLLIIKPLETMNAFCPYLSEIFQCNSGLKFGTVAILPNAAAEWLAFLVPIREVPGSDVSPETGYPKVFRGFPQALQVNAEILP
jgi:hypothetical protein